MRAQAQPLLLAGESDGEELHPKPPREDLVLSQQAWVLGLPTGLGRGEGGLPVMGELGPFRAAPSPVLAAQGSGGYRAPDALVRPLAPTGALVLHGFLYVLQRSKFHFHLPSEGGLEEVRPQQVPPDGFHVEDVQKVLDYARTPCLH